MKIFIVPLCVFYNRKKNIFDSKIKSYYFSNNITMKLKYKNHYNLKYIDFQFIFL